MSSHVRRQYKRKKEIKLEEVMTAFNRLYHSGITLPNMITIAVHPILIEEVDKMAIKYETTREIIFDGNNATAFDEAFDNFQERLG